MKKQKKIFIAVFSALLVIMSVGILSVYGNVKKNRTNLQSDLVSHYIREDFQLLSIAAAEQLDPDYEAVTFNGDVSKDVQKKIRETVAAQLEREMYALNKEKDFVFSVKNNKTGKELSAHTDRMKDNQEYMYRETWNYGDKGVLDTGRDLLSDPFSLRGDSFQYNLFPFDYTESAEGEAFLILGETVPVSRIQINAPKNLTVQVTIPSEISNDGYFGSLISSFDLYSEFIIISLLIGSAILLLFFLFYPIRIIEEVNPFKTTKTWKLGVLIILLSMAVTFTIMGTVMLSGITLNGALVELLDKYHIPFSDLMVMAGNLVMWMITFLCISVCYFQIKYIFTHGIGRYLREDTIIGSIWKSVKKEMNTITSVDLSKPLHSKIIKIIAIHTVIVGFLATFWIFSYPFIIIYAIVCFVWIIKKLDVIQKDYNRLRKATSELGQGSFNEDINEDVGIFNGLKDEFKQIKINFEKAVKEETKSQNMKTELISNVSHDLKTPLTCIKNYVVLLQNDELSEEERHEYLNNLNQYTGRLTTLIEDLFDVSKVNSGNMKLDLMKINIIALLEQSLAECGDMLEEKGLEVIRTMSSNEIELTLDGGKTYRIFENLITNAGKYAMPHTRIYMDVREDEEEVVIEFKNMSATQMNFTEEEIVDRFVRGDKSRHEGGSGIGLAIVKSFTEVQGGSFRINIDGDLFKAILRFPKDK